jgi:YfiR/HmsC-like
MRLCAFAAEIQLIYFILRVTPKNKVVIHLPRLFGVFVSLGSNTSRTCSRQLVVSSHHTRARRSRTTAGLLVFTIAITSPFLAVAQEYVPAQSRSKAAFLATFPNFVDWPDGAFPAPNSPLVACVLGDFRFGTTLAEVSRDAAPHGRRISVRWIKNDEQIHGCHILFVSGSELSRYSKVIALVQGTNTFTVGETPNFLSAGGMLSISFENEAVQFEVNLGSARDAHFHVSSRLLALAHRVVDPTESTRN